MKTYENGKLIGIIGALLCFLANVVAIFTADNIKEFFILNFFFGIIGTIFSLVAVFEFNYINKKILEQIDLEVIWTI